METSKSNPQVLPNHAGVSFYLMRQSGAVHCVITTATLETYFWLVPNATDAQILKTFLNGYSRISAIAERKLLASNATQLELTPSDFARA
jgi:hypothetical protein